MKLNTSPRVGLNDPDLQRHLRDVSNQVNAITEGRASAVYNASTAAPTTGEYKTGDFVKNSAPAELGLPGSRYIITGWMNISGTFFQCRVLTGN